MRFVPEDVFYQRLRNTIMLLMKLGCDGNILFRCATRLGITSDVFDLAAAARSIPMSSWSAGPKRLLARCGSHSPPRLPSFEAIAGTPSAFCARHSAMRRLRFSRGPALPRSGWRPTIHSTTNWTKSACRERECVEKQQFFELAERLANSTSTAEQKRLKEELARMTFGE